MIHVFARSQEVDERGVGDGDPLPRDLKMKKFACGPVRGVPNEGPQERCMALTRSIVKPRRAGLSVQEPRFTNTIIRVLLTRCYIPGDSQIYPCGRAASRIQKLQKEKSRSRRGPLNFAPVCPVNICAIVGWMKAGKTVVVHNKSTSLNAVKLISQNFWITCKADCHPRISARNAFVICYVRQNQPFGMLYCRRKPSIHFLSICKSYVRYWRFRRDGTICLQMDGST